MFLMETKSQVSDKFLNTEETEIGLVIPQQSPPTDIISMCETRKKKIVFHLFHQNKM